MTKQLLNTITRIIVLISFGLFNLFIAPYAPSQWPTVIHYLAALLSFYAATRYYRLALKIAEAIDEPPTFEVIIEDRETQASTISTEEPDDEAPENYAHPV